MRTWRGRPRANRLCRHDHARDAVPANALLIDHVVLFMSRPELLDIRRGMRNRFDIFFGHCRPSVHAADQACFPRNAIARGRKEDAGKVTVSLMESRMMKTAVVFDPLAVAESNATSYPEPYRADNQQRWNRRR